ncbi:MAG: hypothetical protein P1V81_17345, partial [Planctomycetota bacterium]|nr:hypothetical protein [Planctomycetota bacterium]
PWAGMDIIEEARAGLEGVEFDWLLRDVEGQVALCETAGFGEVPDALLRYGKDRLDAYSDAIASILEAIPEGGPCQQEGRGVGTDLETLGYGRRGLYVFDWSHWSGPYRRIVVPGRPMPSHMLEELLGDALRAVPAVAISFSDVRSFQLDDHLPCRRLRPS